MHTSNRNQVDFADGIVTKRHGGGDGAQRAGRAAAALEQAGAFGMSVPEVVELHGAMLRTVDVGAVTDGAALLGDDPAAVLLAIGAFAADLHHRPPPMSWPLPDDAPATWVHGDLCPVNVLFDDEAALVAVVDWEDSHIGEALDDFVWTEWLVRTWHPAAVDALGGLYAEVEVPDAEHRRSAMRRCLRRHRDRDSAGADWDRHLAALDDLPLAMPSGASA